jgi:hypothetical protein
MDSHAGKFCPQNLFSIYFRTGLGCHSDNGGISVPFKKLSGKDVSFVDMTAEETVSHRATLG